MPKRKNDSDDEVVQSDEESEAQLSEDSEPVKKPKKSKDSKKAAPATKKSKTESKASSSKVTAVGDVQTTAEGDPFIDLGNKKRVTVRSFKGKLLLDIREFYGDESDLKPGKKGISLNLDQWEALRDASGTIDKLLREKNKGK